ncbi:MAG TPA: hypothetical protein VJT09_02025 [Pyrinomonadaceae bacterium]|nr:hypothetical protein [Pyrinomonadaceae bacterium]
MAATPRRSLQMTALALVLSLVQVYVVGVAAATPQGDVQGRLTTRGNQTVTINGNSAGNGQTVASGAMVETPDGVGATVNLGSLGSVDLAPGTKAELTFGGGQIRVHLIQGCVITRIKQGTYGEINNGQEKLTSNDSNQKQAATLDVCNPVGAPAPIVNQGAAANAGAGAGGGAATAGGIGKGWIIVGAAALATGTALAIIVPCRRGRNPSPGEPRGVNDECR